MNTLANFLTYLQNKVFKLLPMREAYDNGENNYLCEYLDNLYINYFGTLHRYPELKDRKELIEVQNNIAYLKENQTIDFRIWRSTVLRSTRLLNSVASDFAKEV